MRRFTHRRSGMSGLGAALILSVLLPAIPSAAPPESPTRAASPALLDLPRRIDANRINMFVTNHGSYAWDIATTNAGLYFPRGQNKTALFAAGLWMAGKVDGELRAAIAEYVMEYGPGPIVAGQPAPSGLPEFIVYKMSRWTGDPADSAHVEAALSDPTADPLVHHSWSEYMAGAVPSGAPWKLYRLADSETPAPDDSLDVPGPDLPGDLATWSLFNDLDSTLHENRLGSTRPLGIEVHHTTWCYTASPLRDVVFLRYRLIHKGVSPIDSAFVTLWADPDIGGFSDDLAGSDVARSLGYDYNATGTDAQYGPNAPAIGLDLLQGPIGPLGDTLEVRSLVDYRNGTDPASVIGTFNYMLGNQRHGAPFVDPTMGLPTTFLHGGDPVVSTGWLDSIPGDRRIMVTAGLFTMSPGDTQEVVGAVVIGQGANRLGSIVAMRYNDDVLQQFWDTGTIGPGPPPSDSCGVTLVNCPRSAEFWSEECAGANRLSPGVLDSIAVDVDRRMGAFDWAPGTDRVQFCALMTNPAPDARGEAHRQAVAVFATIAASAMGVREPADRCVFLDHNLPIECTAFPLIPTIGALTAVVDSSLFLDAEYDDVDETHRRPIEGWFTLQAFFGGADFGELFAGSTISTTQIDSFPPVELRFDGTQLAYRYVTHELPNGQGAYNGDRGWLFRGFVEVPFQVWDTRRNVQLDVLFSEREIVLDSNGTLAPPEQQPATWDSTWAPDTTGYGGEEYLFVTSSGYSGAPNPALTVDGLPIQGQAPVLYVLAVRLRAGTDEFDPADRFRFLPRFGSNGSLDEQLYMLERQAANDPAAIAEWQSIIDCVRPITRGEGIGPTCDIAVATLVSLIEAHASPDGVSLRWLASTTGLQATLERKVGDEDWQPIAWMSADPAGYLVYEDRDVRPGARHGYRLVVNGAPYGEVALLVPTIHRLALSGFVPNPAGAEVAVEFSLPAAGSARLELFDIAGRRVASRDVGAFGPGRHRLRLSDVDRVPPGIYLVRLSRGSDVVVTRGVRLE